MQPLSKISYKKLFISLILFGISSLISAYLAWYLKQPTHVSFDVFFDFLGSSILLGIIKHTTQLGLGLYLLYIGVELSLPNGGLSTWKIIRQFKKSIFSRLFSLGILFTLFAGLFFGSGIVYLVFNETHMGYGLVAFGLYFLLACLLSIWLVSEVPTLVWGLRKRGLFDAVMRSILIMVGFIFIIKDLMSYSV